jgi:hypothetical protein
MAIEEPRFQILMVLYDRFDPMDIVGPHEAFSRLLAASGQNRLGGRFAAEKIQLEMQYNPRPHTLGGDPTVADSALWQPALAEFRSKYGSSLMDAIRGARS